MTEIAPTSMTAPALFLGVQPGFGDASAIELYVLVAPVGHHPVGSTVSRQTLERHGYTILLDERRRNIVAQQSVPLTGT